MNVVLEAGEARAEIDLRAGARVASLSVEGLELLVPKSLEPRSWGLYPMAPFAGRVRRGRFRYHGQEYRLPLNLPPHAIHGSVFTREWRDVGLGHFEIDLGPGWPFPGKAVQKVELDEAGLDLRLEVHAEAEPFPASLGWHPWFRRQLERGGAAQLRFEAAVMYARDREGIPDGRRRSPSAGPWDDCFTQLDGPPVLEWPGALRLRVDSSLDHLVVYDEPEHALCVEPQSGPPDALNLMPTTVEPGKPLAATARLAWQVLDGA